MFRKFLAGTLCAALTTVGCAPATRLSVSPRVLPSTQAPQDSSRLMVEYAQQIPIGSKVRVERSNGHLLRGTLMKATPESIVVQEHTRVPQTPLTIPLGDVARLTLEGQQAWSIGKSIGVGAASGAAATLGVIFLLAALWSD